MRIMTSNIWGDYFKNPVEVRQDGLLTVLKKYNPDVLGLQEVTKGWYESKLFNVLCEDYECVGTELSNNSNYVPLVYKKGYELISKGYERLSEVSDVSKAITWAVIKNTETLNTVAVCNTHFWWMLGAEHDILRVQNAKQLVKVMQYLNQKYSCPVFAFGDMNCLLTSGAFDVYRENGIKYLFDIAKKKDNVSTNHGNPVSGDDGLYHGKRTELDNNHSIDHIICLGDGFEVLQYRVIEDQDVLDATDHSPVFVDVEF